MEDKRYLNFGQKIAYALGNPGVNLINTFIGSFMLIYLTDTIGMNAGIVGTLMMVAKLLDGVTDIIFGAIMDRTKSKLGKARPWIIRMTLPLLICCVLLFSMPTKSGAFQYVYFFIVYVILNAVFYTAVALSYNSLSARITRSNQERVTVSVISFIVNFAIVIGTGFVTMALVNNFGGGTTGWRTTAIVYMAVSLVLIGICALFTKELPDDVLNEGMKVKEKITLKETFGSVLGNRYFWFMCVALISFTIIATSVNTTGTYYVKYILQNESFLGVLNLVGLVPMIIALLATPLLTKKLGLYRTTAYSYLVAIVFAVLTLIFALTKQGVAMLVCMALRGLCIGPFSGTQTAIVAQIVDHTKMTQGRDITGAMFSCTSVGTKVGQALGSALVGWLLTAAGYVGTAATQTPGALTMIIVIFAGIPLLFVIISAIMLLLINPEKEMKALQAGQTTEHIAE